MLGTRTRTGKWLSICGTALGICLATCLLQPSSADDQPAAAPSSGFRMPALLDRLRGKSTRSANAVLDELREIYRQNGLAMPPMTLEGLNRLQESPGEPAVIEPSQHLAPAALPPAPAALPPAPAALPPAPAALPPAPAVDFAPLPIAAPPVIPAPVIPAPTPDPTHVQAVVKQFRQRQQITGRSQRGGLRGFCPVALKDRRELRDARPEFNVTHKGRVILLSSQEARTAFLAQPEAYLPVARGTDLVSVLRRRPRMGQLDYATWYRGRLFLFATKANLIEFQKQPDRFAR